MKRIAVRGMNRESMEKVGVFVQGFSSGIESALSVAFNGAIAAAQCREETKISQALVELIPSLDNLLQAEKS